MWMKDSKDPDEFLDLFNKIFQLNPEERISASEVVNHFFFDEVRDRYMSDIYSKF